MDTDERKESHRVTLQVQHIPATMHRAIKGVIQDVALCVGWRALALKITNSLVEFTLKPYPREERTRREARREEYRQDAKRKRLDTPPSQEGDHNPEL